MNKKTIGYEDSKGPGNTPPPKSTITGVALPSFLQLMQLEQKTCSLTVTSEENVGHVFMEAGEVINAAIGSLATPDLTGVDAFHKLMTWDTPDIAVVDDVQGIEREIQLPLMHLLMESQQQIDEAPAQTKKEQSARTALNAKRLTTMLSNSSGVLAYEVTDPEGESYQEGDSTIQLSPEELIAMGNAMGTILSSKFKSIKINLDDRSSYWAGNISQFSVLVKLKPGFRPGKMMG